MSNNQGYSVGITGIGICVPDNVVTNKDLESRIDTTDEWIASRTGIRQRRIAQESICTSDLGVEAATKALAHAGLQATDIDLIIVGTMSPDLPWPATACIIQAKLGAHQAAAFDLSAGCSGMVYAMATATQFIAGGLYKRVLVIGAETMSRLVNWEDRGTCVLFGDGASAVILEAVPQGGFLSFELGADGRGVEHLYQPAGGCKLPASAETVANKQHYLVMNGREVFKFAVRVMGEAAMKALDKAGISKDEVDYFVPHQANIRIIEAAAKKLELPMEKVFVNVHKYGNTSAASIGIALYEALHDGKLKQGDKVVLVGFGTGLTWAAAVMEWNLNR